MFFLVGVVIGINHLHKFEETFLGLTFIHEFTKTLNLHMTKVITPGFGEHVILNVETSLINYVIRVTHLGHNLTHKVNTYSFMVIEVNTTVLANSSGFDFSKVMKSTCKSDRKISLKLTFSTSFSIMFNYTKGMLPNSTKMVCVLTHIISLDKFWYNIFHCSNISKETKCSCWVICHHHLIKLISDTFLSDYFKTVNILNH